MIRGLVCGKNVFAEIKPFAGKGAGVGARGNRSMMRTCNETHTPNIGNMGNDHLNPGFSDPEKDG